jgi:multidrug efflux pump
MTSLAFIMGVLPLATATGAGAEMRQAMGIAVFAGMIGVTAFGIFLTPVFYVLLRGLTGNRPLTRHGETPHVEAFAGAEREAPAPRVTTAGRDPAPSALRTQE